MNKFKIAVIKKWLTGIFSETGLTLIEILMTMMIVAIFLLSLGPLFTFAAQGINEGKSVTRANMLIQEKFEQLKNSVSLSPGLSSADTTGEFIRFWEIEDAAIDTLLPEGLMRVTVTVEWTAPHSEEKSVAVSTLISEI